MNYNDSFLAIQNTKELERSLEVLKNENIKLEERLQRQRKELKKQDENNKTLLKGFLVLLLAFTLYFAFMVQNGAFL